MWLFSELLIAEKRRRLENFYTMIAFYSHGYFGSRRIFDARHATFSIHFASGIFAGLLGLFHHSRINAQDNIRIYQ